MLTTKLPPSAGITNELSYTSTSPYMHPWRGRERLTILKYLNIHDEKLQTIVHAKYVHYTFTEHYSFSVLFLAFLRVLSSFFFPSFFFFDFSVGI